MEEKTKISIELFFIVKELKASQEELLICCEEQLELLESTPSDYKKKISLVKKEIDLTEQQIEISNEEIDDIINTIDVKGLDEIIEKSRKLYPDIIDNLLDVRSKKTQQKC